MVAFAEVLVQPKTITNLKVSNGTNTYPVEELDDYALTNDGYSFFIGTVQKLNTGNLTFTADHCQTQTQNCYTDTVHTIVMEPAQGYKKMYAWDNGNWYTESATPSVGDDVYIYKPLSDEYTVNGVVTAVSTNTINIQSFT